MGQQLSQVTFLESRPARHSVTLRFRLGHLPFLPFQIFEESDMRSQCNYARKTPILTQTKSGEAFKTITAKQLAWCEGCKSLDRGAQLGNKYRFCMGMTDRPSRATNFDTNLSCLVLWEWKSICFSGTTRENCCSLSTRNAKDKRQSGIVLSPPGSGFEPRTSAT